MVRVSKGTKDPAHRYPCSRRMLAAPLMTREVRRAEFLRVAVGENLRDELSLIGALQSAQRGFDFSVSVGSSAWRAKKLAGPPPNLRRTELSRGPASAGQVHWRRLPRAPMPQRPP